MLVSFIGEVTLNLTLLAIVTAAESKQLGNLFHSSAWKGSPEQL